MENIKPEPQAITDFRQELTALINRCSLENGSDTPDFILAEYLMDCLAIFDKTIERREQWYSRELRRNIPVTEIK